MLHDLSYYTLATTLYLKMDPDYIFKLEALGLDAEAKGRWHNDVIVAMAMPASACPALQHCTVQSVDTAFRISQ